MAVFESPFRRTRSLVAGLLLALTLFEYAPALATGQFIYEDQSSILDTVVNVRGPIAPLRTRALTRLSYRLDAWWGRNDARAFHATNLALHLVNGGLVWTIAATIVPGYGVVATTMFLLHPIQREAVAYGAGRTEVLSLTCLLLAWVVLLPVLSKGRVLAAVVLLALACSAKESAVCGIGLIGLWASLYHPRAWRAWRWLPRYWLALPGSLLLLVGGIAWTTLHFEHTSIADLSRVTYAAVQALAVWRYLGIVLVPYGQSIDHDFLLAPSWVAWLALYMAACAVLLWVLLWLLQRDRVPGVSRAAVLAYGWVVIALALRFVMRIPEALNEHQMYTAMVGLSLGAALVAKATIDRWQGHKIDGEEYACA